MKKILVIRYGTIGDTIFASAFYRELRNALPNAQIDILVDKIAKEVMVNCPYINNIFDINGKYNKILHYIKLFKQYDTVYFLKNDSFFTIVAFLAGVKDRIGFKLHRNKFLTLKYPYKENLHEIDCYLDLLRVSGIKVNNDKTELWIDEGSNNNVKELLNSSKKKILIQAYSRFLQKNWIDKYWVELIRYLSDKCDVQVYYSGGTKDTAFYKNLTDKLKNIKNIPIDTSGQLSVSETMALVKNMDMVIGIDSGVIHIAAALDIPSILIHGATSLKRWKPRSENCTVVSKYFHCYPCCLQSRKKKYCKNKVSKCMLKLTPDHIISILSNRSFFNCPPKISVIIPVYNVEKFLSKCLDSVINQTMKELEIICINDGSTDYSAKMLEEYAKRDSRIKVVNQKNQGLSVVRNNGMKIATGKYISFIDSDDWISPDYYKRMYRAAEEENADIAVSGIMSVHRHYRLTTLRYNYKEVSSDYRRKLELCDVPDHCYVWNKLYKRDSLLKAGVTFKPGVIYEDVLFTPKILYYMDKLVTVPDVKYYYYRHSNTLVKLQNKKARRDFISVREDSRKFLKEHNIDISNIGTEIKKYRVLGITLFKTRKKGLHTEHRLLNFIKW